MTEIIAHRGASRDRRENTLAAFTLALEQGADGIELDVHATRDGTVVVHHDPVVRIDPAGPAVPLADLTDREVAAVRLPGGDPIPTLDAVFDLVGDRATIYVEIKGSSMTEILATCLRRHSTARYAVHAFDHRMPLAVRERLPGTRIGLLSASYPLNVAALLQPATADAFWQHQSLIDVSLVEATHAAGCRVIAWTENDPVHARSLLGMGVDGLCTDIPGVLRTALGLERR
ncbi:MAG TPA: glycerophosphodiester phosphodiesterase [Gemmatimonas sp.]|nr:glycerophosphodiester phosphodiesterase [Gemmatimonas sp.]